MYLVVFEGHAPVPDWIDHLRCQQGHDVCASHGSQAHSCAKAGEPGRAQQGVWPLHDADYRCTGSPRANHDDTSADELVSPEPVDGDTLLT